MLHHLPTELLGRIHVWICISAHKSSTEEAQRLAPPYILVLIYADSRNPGRVSGSTNINRA